MNSYSILYICIAITVCVFFICLAASDYAPKTCETIQATPLLEGDFE